MAFFEVELSAKRPSKLVENPQTLGQHLKSKQIELGISQVGMAKILSVSQETITSWCHDKTQPPISYCPRIITFLGFNPFHCGASGLGARIKKFRIEHGLTQKTLAEISGLDESCICLWEKNKKHSAKQTEDIGRTIKPKIAFQMKALLH